MSPEARLTLSLNVSALVKQKMRGKLHYIACLLPQVVNVQHLGEVTRTHGFLVHVKEVWDSCYLARLKMHH